MPTIKPTVMLFTMLLGLFGLAAPQARATLVITDSSGIATGITGLGTAAGSFDVSFQTGVFADFYASTDDFSNASALNLAIAAALNALTDIPRVPRDGTPDGIGQYVVPTQFTGTGTIFTGASCAVSSGSAGICVAPWNGFGTSFAPSSQIRTWAVATASVPEPAGLSLFAFAALGLGVAGRRLRRRSRS